MLPERLVCDSWCETLLTDAFASSVIDWYGFTCRFAVIGVYFCPAVGSKDDPGRLPPVVFVNGFESETVCRTVNDATSRGDAFSPVPLPIRRCVNEYSTESRTIGRNGESTVSKRITR